MIQPIERDRPARTQPALRLVDTRKIERADWLEVRKSGIGGSDAAAELSSFVFRTTGFNSIRTLATRLKYFQAVSGGLLSTLPLELRLRGNPAALTTFKETIAFD